MKSERTAAFQLVESKVSRTSVCKEQVLTVNECFQLRMGRGVVCFALFFSFNINLTLNRHRYGYTSLHIGVTWFWLAKAVNVHYNQEPSHVQRACLVCAWCCPSSSFVPFCPGTFSSFCQEALSPFLPVHLALAWSRVASSKRLPWIYHTGLLTPYSVLLKSLWNNIIADIFSAWCNQILYIHYLCTPLIGEKTWLVWSRSMWLLSHEAGFGIQVTQTPESMCFYYTLGNFPQNYPFQQQVISMFFFLHPPLDYDFLQGTPDLGMYPLFVAHSRC